MSADGVEVVNYLLSNDAGVGALVAAGNVISGEIPIGTTLPAVSVRHISSVRRLCVTQPAKVLVTERVQITVAAKDRPTQQAVMRAVGAALPYKKATVDGLFVDAIVPDSDGPDLQDSVAQIFEGSRDFLVRFFE